MTRRGEGYCAGELPEADRPALGYAGLQTMSGRCTTLARLWPASWPRPGPGAHSAPVKGY
ncbi:MAG: hypothetical protein P8129_15305 [Anaerolineae bacterium]